MRTELTVLTLTDFVPQTTRDEPFLSSVPFLQLKRVAPNETSYHILLHEKNKSDP